MNAGRLSGNERAPRTGRTTRLSRNVVFMADYAMKAGRADYADRSAEKRPDSGERPLKIDYIVIMIDRPFS
jgi:hypothetical protein